MDTEDLTWETVDTEIDYSCPGFDIRLDSVQFPDGSDGEYHYVDKPGAVVILPFTPQGRVVVIDEWRQAVDHVNRGLPAGTVEPETDMDVEATAARELREETGYVAESFEQLTTVEPSNGVTNAVHHHFVATDCEPAASQDLDHNEDIQVATIEFDDLLDGILDGNITDARTAVSVMQYAMTHSAET